MMRSPGRAPCLCGHAWTRHRGQYGEPHGGACRNCVCEVFEVEPVEAPESAPPPAVAATPNARNEAALPRSTTMSKTYKHHPAADLFPMLAEAQLAELADDIRVNGQHEPIILTADERLLDGRNRLEACRRAGVEPEIQFWDREDDGISATAWVLSKNLKRRHLLPGQAAAVAVDALPLFEKEAKARQRAGAAKGGEASKVSAPGREASSAPKARKVPKSDGKSAAAAAVAVGASTRTVERAKALKERVSPDEWAKIRSGEKTPKQVERETKRATQVAQVRVYRPPAGEFGVIVVDFPWRYDDTLDGSDASRGGTPYPTMSMAEIASYPIPVAKDCAVFLWVTNSHLIDPDAYGVLARSWRELYGLVPKQIRTWVKTRMGLGRVWRNITEHLVRFERGTPVFTTATQTTILAAAAGEHSAKPDQAYAEIEAICASTARLEMFARQERVGWVTSGSELPKKAPAPDGENVHERVSWGASAKSAAPAPPKRRRLTIDDKSGDAA